MELRQLRYLVRVVELGSFGKAAAAMRMAQPALSQQIRKLEEETGVKLLVRHAGGVIPTNAGDVLVRHARAILEDVEIARRETLEHAEVITGRVVIGLPAPIAAAYGTEIVRELLSRYPKVSFNLVQGRSVQLEEWLRAGDLDIALCYNPARTAFLMHETIWREELVLFGARQGEPLPERLTDLTKLAAYPMILPGRPNTIRPVVDHAATRAGVTLRIVLEIDCLSTIIDLAAEGFGYAILNELSIRRDLASGRFDACRLPQPQFSHDLVLSWSVGRPLSRAARELAGFLVRCLQSCYRGFEIS